MPITEGDEVTISYVGQLEDGTVFDTSDRDVALESGLLDAEPDRAYEPLTIDIGDDDVIPGLQEALIGMEEGAETTVQIGPEAAYGEYSEDRIADYDRESFEEMIGDHELEEGFRVETDEGLPGEVTGFDEETVTVDFNHELAGETLVFELEILDVA